MIKRRTIFLTVAALAIVLLLFWSFRPQPVPVSAVAAQRGVLQVTVEQEGRTRVRERYVISAPVAGYMPRQELEVGDPVQAGQVVLTLEPVPSTPLDARARAEAEARVAQAQAGVAAEQSRLNAAEAASQLAQRELQRLQTLVESGDISQSALDQARAEAQRAEANLRAARSAVEAARQELRAARALVQAVGGEGEVGAELIPVTSPVSGQVLAVPRESRGVVSAGEPLLTVGDPGALEVEVDVLSADAVRLRPGMEVLFERWGGPVLRGKVRSVEPTGFTRVSALGVEEQRVWVIADFTSPRAQWQNLGDAYRVEARFILWRDEVLKVPTSALFRVDDEWAAFVVEGDVAHLRRVRIGRQGGLESEVVDGLREGERVITHPDDAIRDGTTIELR